MIKLFTNVPRVIALIDLPDLRWQLELVAGALKYDVTTVIEQLEAGLAGLDSALKVRPAFGVVYVYSPRELERPRGAERVVFKPRVTAANRPCWSCTKPCTHCQQGTTGSSGHGHDNPICGDLLELAREDEYDWAVVVSADLLLIPAIRYLQSHGRKIIHGCFPPVAMDLTRECWRSIDLRVL